jgi:hypothetical protein
MELHVRADAANWKLFKFLSGRLTAGPDVDSSNFYEVTWFLEDDTKHSIFREDEIKYENLILKGELT